MIAKIKSTLICFILFSYSYGYLNAQIIKESVFSTHLKQERKISIYLPDSYADNPLKKYPLIFTLDGSFLNLPTISVLQWMSMIRSAPEAIVISIEHNGQRIIDTDIDVTTARLKPGGLSFKKFLDEELFPRITKDYRISSKRLFIGFSSTAHFPSVYAIDKELFFSGYIMISPNYPEKLQKKLIKAIKNSSKEQFIYLSTSENDIPEHKKSVLKLDSQLSEINTPNFSYHLDNFLGAKHTDLLFRSLLTAIPIAFRKTTIK